MNEAPIRILLVEDDPEDVELLQEMLAETAQDKFSLELAPDLATGLRLLKKGGIDIILLDLNLPDGQGIQTFFRVQELAGRLPIVVMTGLDDEFLGNEMIKKGAQDYLIKGKVDGQVLTRTMRYAIERKKVGERQRLMARVLELLNRRGGDADTIQGILRLLKDFTGFAAIGIRLAEGDDFPYYETMGFPARFVEEERYLCARDGQGELLRDQEGRPVLECMCGNIIRGRTDPLKDFFTEGGSFWTNGTTKLLASTTQGDRQARTRNRCNAVGYESVALIPLRSGDETIGLLQMNDRRENMFTLEMIQFFEKLGASVGITLARKRAEEEKEALEAQLRQQQKLESIGTLASGVAHEINNPLMGILGYAELINTRIKDEEVKEFSEGILEEGNRVARIVRNLLAFSRQEKTSYSPAYLNDIIDASLNLFGTVMKKDQITLKIEVQEELPRIKCRSQQIQQVLMNLLTNARDALNERYQGWHENKRLAVSAHEFERDGERWVRTTVEDLGVGIPEELVQRIFDPFFTTKSRAVGSGHVGTGLGLSVSYGIIRDHRGELWVESEPGEYTRFHMDLRVDNGWTIGGEE